MTNSIETILTPKPAARPRIYAYTIDDAAHAGQLKIGQTTRDVAQRVTEQLKTAAITNYTIELDEPAERLSAPVEPAAEDPIPAPALPASVAETPSALSVFERAMMDW